MSAASNTRYLPSRVARPLTAPAILLLAAILKFYRLSGQSLWADEGNSVALARHGFVEIARRTAFDIHPPFYYWLLKIWITVFGDSEVGLRSLSVVLGILLVYLISKLGSRLFSRRIGLIAAFIAALSPLQIYYAQETRMYMLLTVLGALAVLATLAILRNYSTGVSNKSAGIIYILTVTAGLYTHYAFPLILLVVNLVTFWRLWQTRPVHNSCTARRRKGSLFTICHSQFIHWFSLQIIPLLLYLPWLPTAWRQLTTWPAEKQTDSFLAILETVSTTLLFGLSWPFERGLLAIVILTVTLLITLWLGFKQNWPAIKPVPHAQGAVSPGLGLLILWLWLLLPVGLTILIFSPAFLKFLLAATPALALLLALAVAALACPASPTNRRMSMTIAGYSASGLLLAVVAGASLLSLYHYYYNPAYARDNYRGIVNFIQAVGGPDDAVILNAEGQQDVFTYYYDQAQTAQAPLFPLPRQRPLDEAATLAELETIANDADNVYAVYWAARQADPEGVIEGWLNNRLFKATDRWYGNVRLAGYGTPLASQPFIPVDYQLGDQIRLTGYALSSTQVKPADILQVALRWETDGPLSTNYTVFGQVLDQANHLVAQRDAPPAIPTSQWPVGQAIEDGHGIFIEPGTPPGPHRLIVGLYDNQTGQRLPVTAADGTGALPTTDFVELEQVDVVAQEVPLSPEAFDIQVHLKAPMLEVTLLGYDLYKLGHRSNPDTPLQPGDPLHLVAYWQVDQPIRRLEDQLFIQVISAGGGEELLSFTRPPAGTNYPIGVWQTGEIVRAQYDLTLNGLEPGLYRLALTLEVSQSSGQQVVALTRPFRVE